MNSVTELFLVFIIYSFLGWCLEVLVTLVQTKKLVNRGFLFSPICPIYGFAVVSIVLVSDYVARDPLTLFFVGVIMTVIFELITGYILEKVFNKKWWDYSKEPFNIGGYVCLWVSIVWGIISVLTIYAINPGIYSFVSGLSESTSSLISFVFAVLIFADLTITVIALVQVKKRMTILDDIKRHIGVLSETINNSELVSKINKLKVQSDIDGLMERYQKLIAKRVLGNNRFAMAFPKLDLIRTIRESRKKKK